LRNDLDGLKRALRHNANANIRHRCARARVRLCARVIAVLSDGAIPLHTAAWKGHIEIVNALVDITYNIDATVRNRVAETNTHTYMHGRAQMIDGTTALQCAVDQGHGDIARVLLRRGCDLCEGDHRTNTRTVPI
jgi:ankyrin repeat protein